MAYLLGEDDIRPSMPEKKGGVSTLPPAPPSSFPPGTKPEEPKRYIGILGWPVDMKYLSQMYQTGYLPIVRGSYGNAMRMGTMSDEEGFKQASEAVSKKIEDIGEIEDVTWKSPIPKLAGETAKLLPFVIQAGMHAAKRGLQVGIGTGVLASVLGIPGPDPTDLITVPSAGMQGLAVGARWGILEYSLQVEGGNVYMDLRKAGIAKDKAQILATAGGLGIGVVEGMQLNMLSKPFKRLFARKVLTNPKAQGILVSLLKNYGKQVGGEWSEEMIQEAIQIGMQTLGGMWEDDPSIVPTREVWKNRLIETGKGSAAGMAGLGILGLPLDATSMAVDKWSKKAEETVADEKIEFDKRPTVDYEPGKGFTEDGKPVETSLTEDVSNIEDVAVKQDIDPTYRMEEYRPGVEDSEERPTSYQWRELPEEKKVVAVSKAQEFLQKTLFPIKVHGKVTEQTRKLLYPDLPEIVQDKVQRFVNDLVEQGVGDTDIQVALGKFMTSAEIEDLVVWEGGSFNKNSKESPGEIEVWSGLTHTWSKLSTLVHELEKQGKTPKDMTYMALRREDESTQAGEMFNAAYKVAEKEGIRFEEVSTLTTRQKKIENIRGAVREKLPEGRDLFNSTKEASKMTLAEAEAALAELETIEANREQQGQITGDASVIHDRLVLEERIEALSQTIQADKKYPEGVAKRRSPLKDITTRRLNNLRTRVKAAAEAISKIPVRVFTGIEYAGEGVRMYVQRDGKKHFMASGIARSRDKIYIHKRTLDRYYKLYKAGKSFFANQEIQAIPEGLSQREFFKFAMEHERVHLSTGLDAGVLDENIINKLALERIGRKDLADQIHIPMKPRLVEEVVEEEVERLTEEKRDTGIDIVDETMEKVDDPTVSNEQAVTEMKLDAEVEEKKAEIGDENDLPPEGEAVDMQEGLLDRVGKFLTDRGIDITGKNLADVVTELGPNHPVVKELRESPDIAIWLPGGEGMVVKKNIWELTDKDKENRPSTGFNERSEWDTIAGDMGIGDDNPTDVTEASKTESAKWTLKARALAETYVSAKHLLGIQNKKILWLQGKLKQEITALSAEIKALQESLQQLTERAMHRLTDANLPPDARLEIQENLGNTKTDVANTSKRLNAKIRIKARKALELENAQKKFAAHAEVVESWFAREKAAYLKNAPAEVKETLDQVLHNIRKIKTDEELIDFLGGLPKFKGMPRIHLDNAPTEGAQLASFRLRMALAFTKFFDARNALKSGAFDTMAAWVGEERVSRWEERARMRKGTKIFEKDIQDTLVGKLVSLKDKAPFNAMVAAKIQNECVVEPIYRIVKAEGYKVSKTGPTPAFKLRQAFYEKVMQLAAHEIYTDGKNMSSYKPSDVGKNLPHANNEVMQDYLIMRAAMYLMGQGRNPWKADKSIKPEMWKMIEAVIAQSPQWAKAREPMAYFSMLPAKLQAHLVYSKNVMTRLGNDQIALNIWDASNIAKKERTGWMHRTVQKVEAQKLVGGVKQTPLRTQTTPSQRYETPEEFYFDQVGHPLRKPGGSYGLIPIDNYGMMLGEYIKESMTRIDYQKAINYFKKLPSPMSGLNLVEHLPSVAKKLGIDEQQATNLLTKNHFRLINEAPGFSEWIGGSFQVPWIHIDAFNLVTEMLKMRETGQLMKGWLGMNSLVKRVVMPTPYMFMVQIASTPMAHMPSKIGEFLQPIVPFGDFKTVGLKSIIPRLMRNGFAIGGEIVKGEYSPTAHLQDGYDLALLSLLVQNGMPGFDFEQSMAMMFEKTMSNMHPAERSKLKNIWEALSSKWGIDQYTFDAYIPKVLYEFTKFNFERFKKKGLSDETAARRAAILTGDLTGMAKASTFGLEGQWLRAILFARNFVTTFFRQTTGAMFAVPAFRKAFHKYHKGLFSFLNPLVHGTTTRADMEALAPYYVAHLARILGAKFMIVNGLQAGMLGLFGDDDDKQRLFAFQNANGKWFSIRLPHAWSSKLTKGAYPNKYIYVDILNMREANQLADMTGLMGGRGFMKFMRSKLNYGANMVMSYATGDDMWGNPISAPDLPASQIIKDWAKHHAESGIPTPFVGDVRKIPGDYFSLFLGLPMKIGEPYEAGATVEMMKRSDELGRLLRLEEDRKRRRNKYLSAHPKEVDKLFEKGELTLEERERILKSEEIHYTDKLLRYQKRFEELKERYP